MTRLACLLLVSALALAACVPTPAVPQPTLPPPTAVPTVPPAPTAPPTATPGPKVLVAPRTLAALEPWIADQWAQGTDPALVQAALQAAGWQKDAARDWRTADLLGDGHAEWLASIIDQAKPAPPSGPTGQFWIVGASGILYRYDASGQGYFTAPVPRFVADLTGDGKLDAVAEMQGCGASTCVNAYLVLTAHGGALRNVAKPAPGSPAPTEDGIVMATVTNVHLGGTQPETLVITGGILGSVGAGVTRERTETWGWDGTAMVLQKTLWAPSNYVHHVLYDGNIAFDAGDEQTAVAAYTRVIKDDTLQDVPGNATGASARPAARAFAAFRMIVLALRAPDEAQAFNWSDWLKENAPGTAFARAAETLMKQWSATQDLQAACKAVTEQLAGETNPTSPLDDLGYGNPSLTAKDVCPVQK